MHGTEASVAQASHHNFFYFLFQIIQIQTILSPTRKIFIQIYHSTKIKLKISTRLKNFICSNMTNSIFNQGEKLWVEHVEEFV